MPPALNALPRQADRTPSGLQVACDQIELKFRNSSLNNAFNSKKDEFYTQYDDILKEMNYHREQFKGKTIFCNCDDPFKSAFVRYFVKHFSELQISRLIATGYQFSDSSEERQVAKYSIGALKAVVTEVIPDTSVDLDGSLDFDALFSMAGNSLTPLSGNGDFRSDECDALLEEADIVITNPPFSLFREYVARLERQKKNFIILGNMNAATAKEIFPLFRDNKLWYGESIRSGDRKFHVPQDYPLDAAGCGIDSKGHRFIRVKGVRWFTNLDTIRRHEPIILNSRYTAKEYPRYENYNAVDVGRVQNIPIDFNGIMGVPITFLDRYNPDQFEIVMLANGNARTNVCAKTLEEVGYCPHPEDRGGVGIIAGRRVYARILIRRKTL